MFWASQPTSEFSFMPSGGGKKGGGGGSVTAPTISIPPGLLQALNSIEGLGQYGTGTFDTLAGLGNWAANIATGGNNIGIGSFANTASQAGPTVQIGPATSQEGHNVWATSFDPQTGQITFTNSQTGGTFQEALNSSTAEQYLPAQTLQQWNQDYTNRGQGAVGGGFGGQSNWFNSLGPSLQSAWNQIQSIPGIEGETAAFVNQENAQGNQFLNQGNQLFTNSQNLYNEGQQMLSEATSGRGLFPSQATYVNQAVQAEQQQLSQQLASEGLGSSTSGAILRGEASQQGAATAGQLIQGNISAAQNQIGLSQSEANAAANQYQIAQGAQKLALAGQTLQLGEAQAMAGLAQAFQAQTWTEAIQAYQTLGQMMSTTGALYGIDVTGYSNILQANIAQGQLSLEAALGNAQAAIGGMQSLGSGLGAIFGNQGLSGLLSGGAFGGGGAAAGASGFPGAGIITSIGGASADAAGAGAGASGGLLGGLGGIFSGLFSSLGSAGSGILAGIGAIFAAL